MKILVFSFISGKVDVNWQMWKAQIEHIDMRRTSIIVIGQICNECIRELDVTLENLVKPLTVNLNYDYN